VIGRLQEEVRGAAALLRPEQDALTGSPESKHAVEPSRDVEVDERREGILVQLSARVAERCDGRCEGSPEHALTLSCRP